MLDEVKCWVINDAYLTRSNSIVIILLEKHEQECQGQPACKAIVTFDNMIDYRFIESTLSLDYHLVKVEKPFLVKINLSIYRLYTVGVMIEVLAKKSPSILIQAPFTWLKSC